MVCAWHTNVGKFGVVVYLLVYRYWAAGSRLPALCHNSVHSSVAGKTHPRRLWQRNSRRIVTTTSRLSRGHRQVFPAVQCTHPISHVGWQLVAAGHRRAGGSWYKKKVAVSFDSHADDRWLRIALPVFFLFFVFFFVLFFVLFFFFFFELLCSFPYNAHHQYNLT